MAWTTTDKHLQGRIARHTYTYTTVLLKVPSIFVIAFLMGITFLYWILQYSSLGITPFFWVLITFLLGLNNISLGSITVIVMIQ